MPSLGGYVKVPTFVVEHLRLLTPAETALTLIVLRRGSRSHGFVPVQITDSNWQTWTGLSPRQKEYAIAGLREKGLSMAGRGDKAKFSFDAMAFHEFTQRAAVDGAESEVRTKGRAKGVTVPAGTVVHEDCRSKGCQMLCGGPEQSCTPVTVALPSAAAAAVPAASLRQPEPLQIGAPVVGGNGVYTDLKKPRAVRPGAYPQTLKRLADLGFSTAGKPFVRSLVAACGDGAVSDEVLAVAVGMAYAAKRDAQKREGLFLHTVPPLIAAAAAEVEKRNAAASRPAPVESEVRIGARLADRVAEIQAAAGLQCSDLIERLRSADPAVVFEAFDETAVRLVPVAVQHPQWAETKQRFSHLRDEAVRVRVVVTELLSLPRLDC